MTTRLLLAGLGHAHLFVLEALAQGKLGDCQVSVCTAEAAHVYSGMVPGWLAGRYEKHELSLDTARLCAWAGATLVSHHVRGLDPTSRSLLLSNGESVPFDLCSIAVGSEPAGLALPGVGAHAIPLKPFDNVHRLHARLAEVARRGRGAIVVVGAGLAGLEIAMAARARLTLLGASDREVSVTVLGAERTLVSSRGAMLARTLAAACARQRVTVRLGVEVTEVRANAVQLADGAGLSSDCTVWATGAAAPAWLAESGLAVDPRGFLLVDEHLRSPSAVHVFAAGDCATPASWRQTPKAGVYAVRMGPVLAETLAEAVAGRSPRSPFRPQRQFLALVNTGDGRAIASRGPLAISGRWVMRWKDHVDRTFLARFSAR